ncbi:hypothetical protein HJFPF1_04783 [Paramyrothecium foliicola]|nr:hypothetical protein HJFPF1_04783 [Paramyrothecium foliicola]
MKTTSISLPLLLSIGLPAYAAKTTSCVTKTSTQVLPTVTVTTLGDTSTWRGQLMTEGRRIETIYTTAYQVFCSTGLRMHTYTVTEHCPPQPDCPCRGDVPKHFYTTVSVCNSCGKSPLTATLTLPAVTAVPLGTPPQHKGPHQTGSADGKHGADGGAGSGSAHDSHNGSNGGSHGGSGHGANNGASTGSGHGSGQNGDHNSNSGSGHDSNHGKPNPGSPGTNNIPSGNKTPGDNSNANSNKAPAGGDNHSANANSHDSKPPVDQSGAPSPSSNRIETLVRPGASNSPGNADHHDCKDCNKNQPQPTKPVVVASAHSVVRSSSMRWATAGFVIVASLLAL